MSPYVTPSAVMSFKCPRWHRKDTTMNLAIKNNDVLKKGNEPEKASTLFDNLMTMDELMAILKHQYCRRTIYRWISQGMPYKRIRSRYWFPRDEVILWIERS
jgi:hypothetical protein